MANDKGSAPDMIEREQMDGIVAAAGVESASDIMDAFWRSTDSLVAAIEAALENGVLKEAADTAHALKGSAANVGAAGISNCTTEFEKHCVDGNLTGAREAFPSVRECVEKTRAAFSDYFASVNA